MEDTVVLKQHYLYMFRLDYIEVEKENHTPTEEHLIEYFEKYNICNWLGKKEVGDKTGKLHWQMVIWSEHKKTEKQKTAMRKYWTDKLGKATCAIKSGRKIESLCSYSIKEDGHTVTNLPSNVLERIPKWKNKTAEKIKFQDDLKDYIEDRDLGNKSKTAFAYAVMEFYKEKDRRPTRANMQYLMWKYNKLDTLNLLEQWGLISSYAEYEEINHNI